MLRLLPSPPHRLNKISLRELFPAREIASRDLGVDLDAGVLGDEVGCLVVGGWWAGGRADEVGEEEEDEVGEHGKEREEQSEKV